MGWQEKVKELRAHDARLRHVSDKALRQLFEPVAAKGYNPDQERDERGRWTSGGGGGESAVRPSVIGESRTSCLTCGKEIGRATIGPDQGWQHAGPADHQASATLKAELDHRDARAQQGHWYPGAGGKEEPFTARSGSRLQYMYQPSTGRHAYMNLDTDMILSDEEAALHMKGEAEAAVTKGYNPDQERDERGRWSSGGGGEPTHDDIKAGMNARDGWTKTGRSTWTHENGSRVVLTPDGRGKDYGGQIKTYSGNRALSNMAYYAGDKATWMVGHNAKDDTVERMVSHVERGGNELRDSRGASGGGTPVAEGYQVGLSRSTGEAVTDHGEAQTAMRGLFPEASGDHWDKALAGMEHQGDGVWTVPLPQDHADNLESNGYLNVSSGTHMLEGEMP